MTRDNITTYVSATEARERLRALARHARALADALDTLAHDRPINLTDTFVRQDFSTAQARITMAATKIFGWL